MLTAIIQVLRKNPYRNMVKEHSRFKQGMASLRKRPDASDASERKPMATRIVPVEEMERRRAAYTEKTVTEH